MTTTPAEDSTLQSISDHLQYDKLLNNTIVITNIVELISSIIISNAGTDISETINNQSLTKNVIELNVVNKLKEKLAA